MVGAIADVDKFKDEPAQAIGGYIPDVALAIASGGGSAAAKGASTVSKVAKAADDVKGVADDANKVVDQAKALDGALDAKRRQAALDSVDEASQDSHPDGLLDMADSL